MDHDVPTVGRKAAVAAACQPHAEEASCGLRPVITSVQFTQFRVLEHATLPLGRFNLLLGPNGSGKTTASRALRVLSEAAIATFEERPPGRYPDLAGAALAVEFGGALQGARAHLRFDADGQLTATFVDPPAQASHVRSWLAGMQGYTLDPAALARPVPRKSSITLAPDGAGLPAFLARLRADDGERWDGFLAEVRRLFPDIVDLVAAETVDGMVAFSATLHRGISVPAPELSHGTLVVLGLLALAFHPHPPRLLFLEELERGMHPRLLRDVRDLLYRLGFPADVGEARDPVQVIATTHSPYVLDLFVDTPEDVIIAAKDESGAASFKRLVDVPELREMLQSGKLGDLWYSGILGGVP